MILLFGIPSEPPMRLVRDALERMDRPYVMLNQRQFANADIRFSVSATGIDGTLAYDGVEYPLEQFTGIFSRAMDELNLPELSREPNDSPLRRHCRSLHDTLLRWGEVAPARVVNRAAPQGSNGSKPYQAQLIQEQGFRVPETLITNEPELVRDFIAQHGRIIYKSISAVRSIVQEFSARDYGRLEQIRWCPTQFQSYVEGTNVRVHTIGNKAFAAAITSDATDYRYAVAQTGGPATLRGVELSDELAKRCLALSESLGLALAGIDLKVTPDNEVYCFEVNPCPAFSYYELNTGEPISDAIAEYLAGRNEF